MLGGPLPRDEGHITTLVYVQIFFALSTTEKVFYSYHAGQTKDGKDFETFLGKAEFEDRISHQYDDFLHKVFSRCRTDDMKSNWLQSPAAEDRAKRALEEGEEDEDDVGDGDDEDDNEQSSVTETRTLSEYELTKQRNIAENKVILDQIKADFGHDKLVEASKRDAQARDNGKEGKGKGKAKEKEKDVTTFIQKRVSPRIADSKKCVYIHMTTNKLDINVS